MIQAQEKLSSSFRWNTFSSWFYQIMYTIHMILIFNVMDTTTFGLMGTCFASVYLAVSIADWGLVSSLPSLFIEYCSSKQACKRFLYYQALIQIGLWIFSAILFMFFAHYYISLYPGIMLIMFLLFLQESILKLVKTILLLTWHHQEVALLDIFYITLYIMLVWSSYYIFHTVTIPSLLIPLIISSGLSTVFLSKYIVQWYRLLPDTQQEHTNSFGIRIIKNRLYTYWNELSMLIFSSNLIVPIIAATMGLQHVVLYKLLNRITHFFSAIMQHTIGNTGMAYFSYLKNSYDIKSKQEAFSAMTIRLFALLGFFLVVGSFVSTKISPYVLPSEQPSISLFGFMLCLGALLSQNIFITYKSFYIAEEQSLYLVFCNSASLLLTFIITYYWHQTPYSLLGTIISIRCAGLFVLSWIAYKRWHIHPFATTTWFHILGYSAVSLSVFFILRYV